jgi:hypothetical protein
MRTRLQWLGLTVSAALGVVGCSGSSSGNAGGTDGGGAHDAGADVTTPQDSGQGQDATSNDSGGGNDTGSDALPPGDSGGDAADGSCPSTWFTPPTVDPSITPPVDGGPEAGAVFLHGAGVGTQNYMCECPDAGSDADGGEAGACAWTLVAPAANLSDCNGVVFAVHSAPTGSTHPMWTSTDGSDVVGHKLAAFDAGAASIPGLLLEAASYGDAGGVMNEVQYVQRLDTDGGNPPATGCDSAHGGATTDVGYTADYYFWAK